MKSYPTSYKGTRFRSRLEASWACAFDLLGISWRYEPFDVAGYIPDFLLNEHLLVEIKPLTWTVRDDSPIAEAREKLEGAGLPYHLALLGLDFSACEWKQGPEWSRLDPRWTLGAGDLFAELGPIKGTKPLRYVGTQDFARIWRTAQSRVQWRQKQARVIRRPEAL